VCPDLRVAQWTGSTMLDPATPRSPSVTSAASSESEGCSVEAPMRDVAIVNQLPGSSEGMQCLICMHLRSPQGLSDPYEINGDYEKSGEVYGERPVYAKVPLTSANECEGGGQLYIFFDDMSGRWQLSPEVAAVGRSVARSPVGWDSNVPPAGALWQLRVPDNVAALGATLGIRGTSRQAPSFRDWADLMVTGIVQTDISRTVIFGGETIVQALDNHTLSGDFRLLQERYGGRPVYRRAAQSGGSPALHLFFEPRSGYWVVSSGSPFAADPTSNVGAPGLFGEVFARSGPEWTAFTPEASFKWEVFSMQDLRQEDLLDYHGQAPDSILSPLHEPAPWLRLHALSMAVPPKWLCMGGFGNRTKTLNGVYELLQEARWSSRPAWQKLPTRVGGDATEFVKYLFFCSETGHWVVGTELHEPQSVLARNGPGRWAAEYPDQTSRRWAAVNGRVFEEDARIFCRRQRTATGGLEHRVLSSPSSPARSPRTIARSTAVAAHAVAEAIASAARGRSTASSPSKCPNDSRPPLPATLRRSPSPRGGPLTGDDTATEKAQANFARSTSASAPQLANLPSARKTGSKASQPGITPRATSPGRHLKMSAAEIGGAIGEGPLHPTSNLATATPRPTVASPNQELQPPEPAEGTATKLRVPSPQQNPRARNLQGVTIPATPRQVSRNTFGAPVGGRRQGRSPSRGRQPGQGSGGSAGWR